VRGVQTVGFLAFSVLGVFIAVNAMFLQPGTHPSPFGTLSKSAQAKPKRAFTKNVPKPRHHPPKPASTTPKSVALAPIKPKTKPKSRVSNDFDKTALQKKLRHTVKKAIKSPPAVKISTSGIHNTKATIRLVQMGLAELGYNPGPVDGTLGEQTKVAIREFEKHHKLAITGRVTAALIKELRNVTGTSVLKVL